MSVIQLGPFLLNFKLLIFILSAFTGYLALKYRLLKLEVEEHIGEKFSHALFIGFFTWKLSPILFDPASVFRYPMSLLYFDGGDRGVGLALFVSLVYLWIRARKDGTSITTNLDLIGAGWIASSSIYHLLFMAADNTNILFYTLHVLINVVLAYCLYADKETARNPVMNNRCWIWYSLGMIGIFFVQKGRTFWIAGFTKEQVIFFIVFIIALGLENVLDKKKKEVS